jgi:hypothetical protein
MRVSPKKIMIAKNSIERTYCAVGFLGGFDCDFAIKYF